MRRVAVIGTASGAGKTTFARALAARLGTPFVELDALNHRRGWTEATAAELRAEVEPLVARERWVIDGDYTSKLGTLVLDAADAVVWLDPSMRVWLPRLLRRTFRRIVTREELWSGNRETFRGAFAGREALLPYTFRTYRRRRREYPARFGAYPLVRLRTVGEIEAFLESASPARVGPRSLDRSSAAHAAARNPSQIGVSRP
jgi:adenylate kinase family enzyme